MRSSFTAMALALAFVTVTALPAMAFTLLEDPVGGEEVGAVPPNGALPAPGAESEIDKALLGESLGLDTKGASPPTTRPQSSPVGLDTKGASPPTTRPQSSPVAGFGPEGRGGTKGASPPNTRPQTVSPAAVVGQKVGLPPGAIAPSAKPAELAPRN